MTDPTALPAELAKLRDPACIRQRCGRVFESVRAGQSQWFELDLSRMQATAQLTAEVTRARYPDLHVPPHSRFGHFDVGGVPRLAQVEEALSGLSHRERARRLVELVVISVLVDAGAGPTWTFRDEDGSRHGRSEGLAVASLRWAQCGQLSQDMAAFRVDAQRLCGVTAAQLATAFQVQADNPLVGVAGRAALLNALGTAVQERDDLFPGARIGGLVDTLWARAEGGKLPASQVLAAVLDGLGGIWPGRLERAGRPLGDVWPHPAAGGEGLNTGLVPLHKLSQWLTYSLLHPLCVAGLDITGLDELTGLAEYRNGGLFIDSGVLIPKRLEITERPHTGDNELVVEWRALTVALLDRLLDPVRAELGVDPSRFPLAAMLEGGTWAAGRQLAQQARPNAAPPIQLQSDGTLF